MSGVTNDQIQVTTQAVLKSTPEMAPYDLEDGSLWSKCHAYIMGAFPESILSEAGWQIAFKDLLAQGRLKRIPNYVAPVTDAQRRLVNDTPGYIARDLYKTDPSFREAFDLVAAEEKEHKDLHDWAIRYKTMSETDPNGTAFRLANEPGFSDAVQKLIDAGLI
jgi:hypothetical protein